MRSTPAFAFVLLSLLAVACAGEESPMAEKETDNKATETKQVKLKAEQESSEKGKRAPVALTAVPTSLNSIPAHPKVMIMPPVSLMIAMPHPSGRFLMLFPTTQLVPLLPMPYASASAAHSTPAHAPAHAAAQTHHDHPALFAARQQMLYSGPTYQPPREQYYQQYPSSNYNSGYGQKRMPVEM